MKRFRKFLVGVDLSWGDRFVSEDLSAPNAEAVRQALWLAQLNSASIDFLPSLDLSAKAQQLISESNTDESTVLGVAEDRLAELVAKAQDAGVAAKNHVVVGKSWLELIRQVLRQQHDLVLVGTRQMGALQGFFLGSTGIKLWRKCPCAVWVTQPRADQDFDSILVAHDLRPVGDLAMELGIDLLVMGRVGRTGITGFITGNTAERLLPRIPCSLLAVKPPGFESPVALG